MIEHEHSRPSQPLDIMRADILRVSSEVCVLAANDLVRVLSNAGVMDSVGPLELLWCPICQRWRLCLPPYCPDGHLTIQIRGEE